MQENQVSSERAQTFKDQLERQRETYNRLLTLTEQRVIEANNAITMAFNEGGEDKQKAAEFLSNQVYQLYEERRHLISEKDQLQEAFNELERANVSLRCDLERYRQLLSEDFLHGGHLNNASTV
jgi:predicted RNA polymerase sigma factor